MSEPPPHSSGIPPVNVHPATFTAPEPPSNPPELPSTSASQRSAQSNQSNGRSTHAGPQTPPIPRISTYLGLPTTPRLNPQVIPPSDLLNYRSRHSLLDDHHINPWQGPSESRSSDSRFTSAPSNFSEPASTLARTDGPMVRHPHPPNYLHQVGILDHGLQRPTMASTMASTMTSYNVGHATHWQQQVYRCPQPQVYGVPEQHMHGDPQQQVYRGPQPQVSGGPQQYVHGDPQRQVSGGPQQQVHGGPQSIPDDMRSFKCDKCSAAFSKKSELYKYSKSKHRKDRHAKPRSSSSRNVPKASSAKKK